MIGSIRGKVIRTEGMTALIEVQGLGYEVEVTGQCLPLLKTGEEIFLYVHHVVREDAQLLFGFVSFEQRALFRELVRISGIGPKIALSLLSAISVEDFIQAVAQDQVSTIVSIPGIGKKTAERLLIEIKDRLPKLNLGLKEGALNVKANPQNNQALIYKDEAIGALVGLGYKEQIALKLVEKVYQEGMETKEIIMASLAEISRNKK